MRGILFLLVLSALVGLCSSDDSPMKDILHKDSKQSERMTFLVRKVCGQKLPATLSGQTFDTATFLLLGDNYYGVIGSTGGGRTEAACSDTIGFLPINDEKVQVFVTVNLDNGKIPTLLNPALTEDRKVLSIKLSYESSDGITLPNTPLIDCHHSDGTVTATNAADKKAFKVTKIDKWLHDKDPLFVQCQSFIIEKGEDTDAIPLTDINSLMWTLEVTLNNLPPLQTEDEPNPRKYKGKLRGDTNLQHQNLNIFDKKRCDPDKLVLSNPPSDKEKEYKNLVKTPGPADTMKIWVKKDSGYVEDNLHKTVVTGCRTEQEGETDLHMEYTVGTESVEAEQILCELDAATVKWRYVATLSTQTAGVYDTKVLDGPGTITVECSRRQCRKCAYNHKHAEGCHIDHGRCGIVQQMPGAKYSDCHYLDTNACATGLMLLNNATSAEKYTIPAKIECDNDGKYFLPNGGAAIKALQCPTQFSRVQSESKAHKPKNGTALDACTPTPALQCGDATGCICGLTAETKIPKKLAIVNNAKASDSTTWLRIETLKFANDTGDWTYTRKHKDGKTKTHTIGKDYGFACVDPTPDPRSEEQKAELKRNPSKNIVFILNIVLLAVIAGVTIPAVIFYVNARIKEREAKKAAKKDKKKEEPQSGEKKDGGEPKKDEEKKNEA